MTDVTDDRTVIDFDDHGVRKFVTDLVSLTLTDRPAPERSTRRRTKKKTS